MDRHDALGLTLDELIAHDRFVRGLARALTSDAAAADDVAQDAWAATLRKPPRVGSNLRAWLGGVVRRLAWKTHRGDGRRRRREERAARPESVVSPADELAERESTRAALVAAVMRLDEPYRETVLLRYFRPLEPAEIARRMGVPAGTVRHRLFAALGKLRADLDAAHDGTRERWLAVLAPIGAPTFGGAAGGGGTIASAAAFGSAAGGALLVTTKAKALSTVVALLLAALVWRERSWDAPSGGIESGRGSAVDRPTARSESALIDVDGAADAARRAVGAAPFVEATPFGELKVIATRDGAPVAGLAMVVTERAHGTSIPNTRRIATDATGSASLPHVRAGVAHIRSDVGATALVEVPAGGTGTARLELVGGFTLIGRVVDDSERPIAGASVYLAGHSSAALVDPPTTLCDESGSFRLDCIRGGAFVSARAVGFAPSLWTSQRGGEGTDVETTIKLRRGTAGGVVGLVLLPDGTPAAGADVNVRSAPEGEDEAAFDVRRRREPFAAGRTDERGRFRFDAVAAGALRVEARTSGAAPGFKDATLARGGTAEIEIRLTRGATLEGVVRTPEGAPAAGATVGLGGSGVVETDADGAYRVTHVAPGAFSATATLPGVGVAKSVILVAADDAVLRWDATLVAGPTLRVRVVDETDRPVVGARVDATALLDAPGTNPFGSATTDEDGRVKLVDLSKTTYAIRVYVASARGPLADAVSAVPDGPEIVIRATSTTASTCYVVGRLTDGDGAPVSNAPLSMSRDGLSTTVGALSDRDGRFKLGPLPPGRLRASCSTDRFGHTEFGPYDAAPGETWDLGEVRLRAPGELIVRVKTGSASSFAKAPWVGVRSVVGDTDTTGETEDGVARFRLAPGRYFAATLGWSTDRADVETEVEVKSDATTAVDLAPPKGAEVRIALRPAKPPVGYVSADVDVLDAQGRTVCRRRAWTARGGAAVFADVALRLVPGTYVVRAAHDGARGETTFTVSAADVAGSDDAASARPPVVVELR
jgi:RNA polymerase sigma-70 factor (ECF subfamily)